MGLRRLRSRFGAVVGVATAVLALTAGSASAHATLQSTSPAQSQVFPSGHGPSTVTVTFDEAVHGTASSIVVYDPAGRAVPVGGLGDIFETSIAGSLPDLADGTYVTTWRVVSDDGHVEQGAFTFTVGAGGASADIGHLLAGARPSRPLSISYGVDRAIAFLGVLVALGGGLFVRWAWPEAGTRHDVRRLLAGAAVLGGLATLLGVPLQAAYSSADGMSSFLRGSALHGVVSARFGTAALLRAGLLLVALPFLLWVRRGRGGWTLVAEPLYALVAVGTWVTYAYAGHGDSGRWIALGFTVDVVHLAAVSTWLGGLTVLALALRGGRPSPGVAGAMARFSVVALPAMGVVALSGAVQAWRQVGSVHALLHTGYGHLLTVKVLVVVAIAIVASAAKHVVKHHVLDDDVHAARELRNGLVIEVTMAVAVLGVTAALVFSAPAREADAATKQPVAHTVRAEGSAGGIHYTVADQPGLVGTNTIVVTPSAERSSSVAPSTLAGRLTGPDGTGALEVTFTVLTDWRWVASAEFPTAGSWHLVLTADAGTSASTVEVDLVIQ